MGNYKYAFYTDRIYQAVFLEKSKEYRKILELSAQDKMRDTLYAEILTLIAAFEAGLAHEMKKHYDAHQCQKMKPQQLNQLFDEFVSHPMWQPQIEMARTQMASRDYGLRQVIHDNLQHYVTSLSSDEFKRFLGDSSKTVQARIDEHIDVFKRLKDR